MRFVLKTLLIQLDILYNTEYLIKWMCLKPGNTVCINYTTGLSFTVLFYMQLGQLLTQSHSLYDFKHADNNCDGALACNGDKQSTARNRR